MVKAIDTERTGFSLQTRYGRMLVDLFEKEALQSFVEYVG